MNLNLCLKTPIIWQSFTDFILLLLPLIFILLLTICRLLEEHFIQVLDGVEFAASLGYEILHRGAVTDLVDIHLRLLVQLGAAGHDWSGSQK